MLTLIISIIILTTVVIGIMWIRMNRIFALSNIEAYITNTYKPKMSDIGFDILYRFITDFDNNFEYGSCTVYDKKYKVQYWINNAPRWFEVYESNPDNIKFNDVDKMVLWELFSSRLRADSEKSDEILRHYRI